MNFRTWCLCVLNRQRNLRRMLGRVPVLWQIDASIQNALYSVRLETLQRMPKGAECAEIGVWKGDFSADILRITQPTSLHLVDPWALRPDYVPYQDEDVPEATLIGERISEQVRERFRESRVVQVHRTTSKEFLQSLNESSLDWVYIDGDHSEAAVTEDLHLSWRVVRRRGWLAGDDYHWRDESERQTVKAAVDRFCTEFNVAKTVLGTQFIIQKP